MLPGAGIALEGITLVISPLIALMQDQVQQLRNKGIQAIAVHAGMSRHEIDIALDNCVYGKIKFLYLSPERLKTEMFLARFRKMNASLIAIDEAHCISQWGYDFRPPYLEIGALREIKPDVRYLALTATATKRVQDDIVDKAGLRDPLILKRALPVRIFLLSSAKRRTRKRSSWKFYGMYRELLLFM